jgi:hypothetical protein
MLKFGCDKPCSSVTFQTIVQKLTYALTFGVLDNSPTPAVPLNEAVYLLNLYTVLTSTIITFR